MPTKKKVSPLQFCAWLRAKGIREMPQAEYVFHWQRLWRFDYAWPELLVALEIQGGMFGGLNAAAAAQKIVSRIRKKGGRASEHELKQIIGLVNAAGRHAQGSEIGKEHEKLNAAAEDGWVVVYVLPDLLQTEATARVLRQVLYEARERKEMADAFMEKGPPVSLDRHQETIRELPSAVLF